MNFKSEAGKLSATFHFLGLHWSEKELTYLANLSKVPGESVPEIENKDKLALSATLVGTGGIF